jgi:hypothetical protein
MIISLLLLFAADVVISPPAFVLLLVMVLESGVLTEGLDACGNEEAAVLLWE